MPNEARGFTLVELMVVVVIIGIIMGFAVPGYTRHIERTRVTDGKTALLNAYAAMERVYAQKNSYISATLGTDNAATDILSRPAEQQSPPCPSNSAPSSEEYYCISFKSKNAARFTLQAQIRSGSPQQGESTCSTLEINSLGQKVFRGNGTKAECW
jgi:type IV pilus assembly protein PilE